MLSLPDPAMFSGFGVLTAVADRPVAFLQAILRALGAPVGSDGAFGPTTSGAWAVLALSLNLDPKFDRVNGSTARVSTPTLQRLVTEAAVRTVKPKGADDFERLNNAIVQASRFSASYDALARDWTEGTGPVRRSLLMAVPTVWAGVLERFWERYRQLWTPEVWDKVVPPALVQPGGQVQAFKDLWAPAMDSARGARDAVVRAAAEKLKSVAREAGEEFSKGGTQATEAWAWGLAGVGATVFLGWLWLRQKPSKGALGQWDHVDGGCLVKGYGAGSEFPCDDTYENVPRSVEVTFKTTQERHFDMPRRTLSWHQLAKLPGVASRPKFRAHPPR